MSRQPDILFADLERAAGTQQADQADQVDSQARVCDPQLADMLLQFLNQDDPPPGRPEQWLDDQLPEPAAPAGAWTLERLRHSLTQQQLKNQNRGQTADEAKAARRAAWDALLASPAPPPRLQLGKLLITLYESDQPSARAQLIEFFRRLPAKAIGWGVWQGFKQIYKLAEQRHDFVMLGVLCYRLDVQPGREPGAEIERGTWLYMRRRGWRYLRRLGAELPELYPGFAAQVLRHYPAGQNFSSCWIAAQICNHKALIGRTDQGGGYYHVPPAALDQRAFDDSWKKHPEPLLRLLEDAANDKICDFAIRSLEQDFNDVLRDASPAWLARVGARPLPSLHQFVVKLLGDSPEFHQSKLAELGLRDTVLSFLYSSNPQARSYALDYARSYASDLSPTDALALVLEAAPEVRTFALTLLDKRSPQQIGLDALLRLLASREGKDLARNKLKQGYSPTDISDEQFAALAVTSGSSLAAIEQFFKDTKQTVPAGHYCHLLDQPHIPAQVRRRVLNALDGYPKNAIASDWLQQALLRPNLSARAARWLRSGKLDGDALDIDWLKGLVMRPPLRPLALELLSDRDLVKPDQIGTAWLLALVRNADPTLHNFAERYLSTAFQPQHFATAGDSDSGTERLWRLASDPESSAPLRRFVAHFLQRHHPSLNEHHEVGFSPQLSHDDYSYQRLQPLFDDSRPDLRRLAVTLAEPELARWDRPQLLYELADNRYREPRSFACAQLLRLGDNSDDVLSLPVSWLLPEALFQLTESRHKSTRETALTLIRRHYQQVGGAERLAWLMESPDREVGLFAVRLLWDKHRPVPTPADWRRQSDDKDTDWSPPDGRFDSAAALQQFLRKTLFGLPPGRMERRTPSNSEHQALPDRPLAASVSKRRLIDVVKDLALRDLGFAEQVLSVLAEFRYSQAKGESQRCISALAQIRRAHPQLSESVPLPIAHANSILQTVASSS